MTVETAVGTAETAVGTAVGTAETAGTWGTRTVLLSLLCGCLLTVVMEHLCRNRGPVLYRPSVILRLIASYAKAFYVQCGVYFANISAFLDFLELHLLVDSFKNVACPVLDIITSPFWFLKGYADQALTYVHPSVVYTGGFVIPSVLVGLFWYYFNSLPAFIQNSTQNAWNFVQNLGPEREPLIGIVLCSLGIALMWWSFMSPTAVFRTKDKENNVKGVNISAPIKNGKPHHYARFQRDEEEEEEEVVE